MKPVSERAARDALRDEYQAALARTPALTKTIKCRCGYRGSVRIKPEHIDAGFKCSRCKRRV